VQTYILSKGDGILINEKDIKNEYDRNLFLEEIKKSQYKTYTDLVNTYKKVISDKQYKSMNIELQTLIDDYFKKKNSDLKTKLIDIVDTMNKKKPTFDTLWNTSISSYVLKQDDTSEPATIYKKVEIYVYMELISGKLNYSNLSNVSCEFANDKLIEMFNELTSKVKNYNANKNKKIFKLPEQTDGKSPNKPANNENDNPKKETTGGKRSRRRIRKNKKTRKINRRLKYSFV
jgi:hypothetical protein